ncbi:MAG: hypothetical protein P8Y70_18165 [Candidatus Lokiarchaeota archaeon]|jgi:hypothetical protein
MESEIVQITRKIANLILTSPQKMIREDDLKTISRDLNFEEIMSEVYLNLQRVGFELIKTNFLGQGYYILTTDGIDDNITPSQYGILAIIAAIGKDLDEVIPIKDIKEIFEEIWDTDLKFLIDNDYIRKNEEFSIIRLSPLGKAALKNIYNDLQLDNLIKIFENENSEN